MKINWKLPGSITRAQTALILTLLPLGFLTILAVPVGGGFDEIQHFRRTWEMSALHLIPNSQLGEQMSVPQIYRQLSYREQPIVGPVEHDYWLRYGSVPLDAAGWSSRGAATRSVYSPTLLAPQTVAVRYLGRKFQLPALPVLYGARLAGLLTYVVIAYLAVRWIPFGKWTMGLLAAAPLALFQASTLSADTLSNAFGFLFLAGSLAIVDREQLNWWDWGGLVGLIGLLFMAKANVAPIVMVPLLMLRPRDFEDRRAYLALLGSALALFLLEVVGWNLIAYPGERIMITGAGPREHIVYMLGHPIAFFGGIFADLARNGGDYLRGWIAAFGYYYWSVPAAVYWLWGGGFVAAILRDSQLKRPSRRARWVLFGTWVAAYLATAILLQFINVTPGSGEVRELQGRYFTAVMPLPFLSLVGIRWLEDVSIPRWLIAGAGVTSLAFFVAGMILSYHIPCGSSYYQLGLCYQPQYKNWSPELANPPSSPAVTGETRLEQEFTAQCSGLTEIRVWPRHGVGSVGDSVQFSLSEGVSGEDIPLRPAGASGLPDEEWFALTFEPQWASAQQNYRLILEPRSPESGEGTARFVYTQRPENERAQLIVNGEPTEQDLFFQYGCIVGLERALRSVGGGAGD